jgi:hypothetical protein
MAGKSVLWLRSIPLSHHLLDNFFILRLSAANPIWKSTRLPDTIANAADEMRNIETSIAERRRSWVTANRKPAGLLSRLVGPKPQPQGLPSRFLSPDIYWLYRDRYLVILNEPRRLIEELDINQLLESGRGVKVAEALPTYRVFCDLLGLCARVRDLDILPKGYWETAIAPYFASESVCSTIRELWSARSSVDADDIVKVTNMLDARHRSSVCPDPADNPILTLLSLSNARKNSKLLFGTLKSKHFRLCLTPGEKQQVQRMLDLYQSAGNQILGEDAVRLAVSNLSIVMQSLREPELDPADYSQASPGLFALRETPRIAGKTETVLRDLAARITI